MAKKPTVADLMAEIAALRKRVAELEARPPVVIHNHPPAQPQQVFPLHPTPIGQNPIGPGWWPKVGEVWCGTVAAVSLHFPGKDRRWVDISVMPCQPKPAEPAAN